MSRFVQLPLRDRPGEMIDVNPARVAYGQKAGDDYRLVFEGFAGGTHVLRIALPREAVLAMLEEAESEFQQAMARIMPRIGADDDDEDDRPRTAAEIAASDDPSAHTANQATDK